MGSELVEKMKEKKLQDSDKKTNKVTVELANGPTQPQGGDGSGGIIKLQTGEIVITKSQNSAYEDNEEAEQLPWVEHVS